MSELFRKSINDIYIHLEDGLSKRIFENNLLFSLTGNVDFINNTISLSCNCSPFKEYKDRLNSFFKKYDNNNIIVYGAGALGRDFLLLCNTIKITAFCDSDAKKQGNSYCGYNVISPEELKAKYNNCIVIVAVTIDKYITEIADSLLNLGFKKDYIFILKDILASTNTNIYPFQEAQYFDPHIILPRLSKDEVFIDGGCCNCYTDIQFIKYCNNEYKKIIAFEPNPKQYPICVENAKDIRNITIHPYGLWNENIEINFDSRCGAGSARILDKLEENSVKIKAIKLDDILKGERADFIKLDVEGAELNALKGAAQTIVKYRPKLAVCVYHKLEDIWEIPAYILSLNRDYKLYLRHYSLAAGETVLYAV